MRQTQPLLTSEEERALLMRIRDGDRAARDEIVTRNLRLVKRYTRRLRLPKSMAIEDLDHHGYLGLMEAAKRFDLIKYPEIKFATYAMWWIRQRVQAAIRDEGGPFRIPAKLFDVARKIDRGDDAPEHLKKAVQRYRSLVVISYGHTSNIADSCGEREGMSSDLAEDTGNLAEAMKCLTPQQRAAIEGRFYRRETLDAVAEAMGICRQRVSQLETRALEKLRRRMGVEITA